jgi:hypothetical protein
LRSEDVKPSGWLKFCKGVSPCPRRFQTIPVEFLTAPAFNAGYWAQPQISGQAMNPLRGQSSSELLKGMSDTSSSLINHPTLLTPSTNQNSLNSMDLCDKTFYACN